MQNLPLDSLTYSLWIFEGESKTMGEGLLSYDCMQPKIDLKRKREWVGLATGGFWSRSDLGIAGLGYINCIIRKLSISISQL